MSVINHQDKFATNLTSVQIAGVTTTPINSIPSVDAPFYIALDATNANGHYEVVKVTSKTATNINHAATSYAHSTDEEVRLVIPATEMDNLWNATTNAPRGYLLNGKISVADTAGITVSLKTLAGNDPSASDPIYVRIGDSVREITSALSRALADGTNWFNSGSSELATKEVDYFAYVVWDSNSSAVGLSFARIPGANLISDFSATTTNEKYCAGQSDFTSTDEVEVIGRFAATLSAGAGYTWTVPTFTASNLIQRPIYETRWLDCLPTIAVSGGTAPTYSSSTYRYRVIHDRVQYTLNNRNTSGGTAGAGANAITWQLPFDPSATVSDDSGGLGHGMNYENAGTICGTMVCRNAANKAYMRNLSSISTITGADQSDANRLLQAQGIYQF